MLTLTYVLGWSLQGLLGLLIIFALRGNYFREYLVFYSYLSYLFVEGLIRVFVLTFAPNSYLVIYWSTQFLEISAAYCVLWEIYRKILEPFAGTAKMASRLVAVAFLAVLGKAFFAALLARDWVLSKRVIELERDLRSVQATLVILLVGLMVYYQIPVGRNVRGLISGYGFFVGASVILLTLRSYIGTPFQVGWQYLQQASTLGTFLIWCFALYSYAPNPTPIGENELERDYIVIATRTQQAMARARGYLVGLFVS